MTRSAWAFAKSLVLVTLVALPVFLFTDDSQVSRFAKVTPIVGVVVVLVTTMGLIGCWRGLDKLVVAAAGLAGAAAFVQLAQTGRDSNLLGDNASTFSFLLALALGWGCLTSNVIRSDGYSDRSV
jgi:hypothetical protein